MSMDDDLLTRVARLERIEQGKVAGARYARACDAKDLDALRGDVFAADAVLRTPTAEYRGIDQVMAFYATAFEREPGTRRHFIVNQIAEVQPDGAVVVDAYFFFLSADATSVIGWGSYRDVVVVGDGGARIADKTITVDVKTDLDRGWAS